MHNQSILTEHNSYTHNHTYRKGKTMIAEQLVTQNMDLEVTLLQTYAY